MKLDDMNLCDMKLCAMMVKNRRVSLRIFKMSWLGDGGHALNVLNERPMTRSQSLYLQGRRNRSTHLGRIWSPIRESAG